MKNLKNSGGCLTPSKLTPLTLLPSPNDNYDDSADDNDYIYVDENINPPAEYGPEPINCTVGFV